MFTLEDLKKNKKDTVEKILEQSGRDGVISFCSEVLDKRAYFTVDMYGNIKRKENSYIIPAAVFTESDADFIDYTVENLDFTEKTKIEKIGRMTNASIEDVKKNIFKLLSKGECHFAEKHCKELYFKDNNEFFKLMFQYAMMDNMSFEKPLAVYSLQKYFEKFGYSDEVLYLTVSYLGKMRADYHDYENAVMKEISVSKEELREIFRKNIERFNTKKGLEILGYLLTLLSYNYENENRFAAVLKKKIEIFEKDFCDEEKLTGVSAQIFKCLSKEV